MVVIWGGGVQTDVDAYRYKEVTNDVFSRVEAIIMQSAFIVLYNWRYNLINVNYTAAIIMLVLKRWYQ